LLLGGVRDPREPKEKDWGARERFSQPREQAGRNQNKRMKVHTPAAMIGNNDEKRKKKKVFLRFRGTSVEREGLTRTTSPELGGWRGRTGTDKQVANPNI